MEKKTVQQEGSIQGRRRIRRTRIRRKDDSEKELGLRDRTDPVIMWI